MVRQASARPSRFSTRWRGSFIKEHKLNRSPLVDPLGFYGTGKRKATDAGISSKKY